MKKLWDLKKLFSKLEPEEQGWGIIRGVTRLLLLGLFYTIQTKRCQTLWTRVYPWHYQSWYPSEPIYFIYFNVRHPVETQWSSYPLHYGLLLLLQDGDGLKVVDGRSSKIIWENHNFPASGQAVFIVTRGGKNWITRWCRKVPEYLLILFFRCRNRTEMEIDKM